MREIRLSGSEGGEATAFPTPIVIDSDFDVALRISSRSFDSVFRLD